jgi:serine protease AprX
MTVNQTTLSTKTKIGRGWSLCARGLFLAAAFLLGTVTASADGRDKHEGRESNDGHRGHRKIAADLANFPQNSDGTLDVIIQFKATPQMYHFHEMEAHGGTLKFSLYHIRGAAYRIPVSMLEWLEKHPFVAYVSPDRVNKVLFDDEKIPAVMADVARQQYALDGTGIGVAVIDSGVYSHDDLQTSDKTASRIVYAESFVPGDPSTNDAYGHGTHVAGIIAGNGQDSLSGYGQQYMGLAPNANIINLRVLDGNGAGSDSQVIAAIGRAIQLQSTYNIRVINLSLGRPVYESYAQDPLCQAVESAWKAGIVVVVAAGNDGRDNSQGTNGYGTIGAPGSDPSVITVGATKTNGTPTRLDDNIASYSSKGPTLIDHVVKPDLVAPGNRTISLQSPGNYLVTTYSFQNVLPLPTCDSTGTTCTTGAGGQYLQLSGTSMATPVVAGAAALMIQQDPTLTPDTVKARMMKTAWKGYPSTSTAYDALGNGYLAQYDVFTIGAGYLDVDAVLGNTDVATGSATSPIAVYDPTSGTATLVNGQPLTGTSVVWGDSVVWGNSVVWGSDITANSVIWGNSVVWGAGNMTATSVLWGTSVTWGGLLGGDDSYSFGANGEN